MPDIVSPSRDEIVLGKNSKYTQEQNIALSKQANTKTPEQLAEENMPFVYHLVDKEFSRYYKVVGIPRETLVSAGMLGLVVAANKSKYGTFLRYAAFWIRYYIYAEVRGYFFIKRQASYCLKLNKIRKFQARYKNSHDDEEPTYEQLAEMTGFDAQTVEDVLRFDKENSTSAVSYEGMMEDPDNKNKLDAIIESDCDTIDISTMEYTELQDLVCHALHGIQRDAVILRHFGHADNHMIKKKLNIKFSEIDKIISDGIEEIKRHVSLENEWDGSYFGTKAPINVLCDERNKGVDFKKLISDLIADCPEGNCYL